MAAVGTVRETANHFEISGKGVHGVIDTAGLTGRPVVSVEVDGHRVSNAELRVTPIGVEVSAMVSAVPDGYTVQLRLVLPEVGVDGEPVPFAGFAVLATALTSIGGPHLVDGPRHLYELRPLSGTASVVDS